MDNALVTFTIWRISMNVHSYFLDYWFWPRFENYFKSPQFWKMYIYNKNKLRIYSKVTHDKKITYLVFNALTSDRTNFSILRNERLEKVSQGLIMRSVIRSEAKVLLSRWHFLHFQIWKQLLCLIRWKGGNDHAFISGVPVHRSRHFLSSSQLQGIDGSQNLMKVAARSRRIQHGQLESLVRANHKHRSTC